MQKFEFLQQPLLGELAMSWRERKKERKKEGEQMPFIVATYVYASSQGQRTHSAQSFHGAFYTMVINSMNRLTFPNRLKIYNWQYKSFDNTSYLTFLKSFNKVAWQPFCLFPHVL
jgi:hypothetical protein